MLDRWRQKKIFIFLGWKENLRALIRWSNLRTETSQGVYPLKNRMYRNGGRPQIYHFLCVCVCVALDELRWKSCATQAPKVLTPMMVVGVWSCGFSQFSSTFSFSMIVQLLHHDTVMVVCDMSSLAYRHTRVVVPHRCVYIRRPFALENVLCLLLLLLLLLLRLLLRLLLCQYCWYISVQPWRYR